jgi:hypothetical protein
MRWKAILLVPLTFNDGTSVPTATLDAIYDDLFVHFGGYTIAGTVKGAYRMASGAKQVDESHELWVVVEEQELETLRKRVSTYCSMLGQEVMYFEMTGGQIEFIKGEPEEGHANEPGK